MAMQPVASDNSLKELGTTSWTGCDLAAAGDCSALLPGKEAPGAEPQGHMEVPEPGTRRENLCEKNCQLSTTQLAHALKVEQPVAAVSRVPPGLSLETETELENAAETEGLQACRKSEKYLNLVQDTFASPPPFRLSPTEGDTKAEDLSSLEGELADWLSDAEVTSDQADELASSDSGSEGWPLAPDLPEPANRAEELMKEEIGGDGSAKPEEEALSQSLADGFDGNEPKQDLTEATVETRSVHFSVDSDFPQFADEDIDKEGVSVDSKPQDVSSAWQRCLDSDRKPVFSIKPSVSSQPVSTQSVVSSGKQQRGQLLQSQPEPDPMGANQEAAQQVLSQSSPPSATVTMEPANQGAAGTQGSACIVAVREKDSWVERNTQKEKESRQSGLDTDKAVGENHSGDVFGFRERAENLEGNIEENSTISISKQTLTTRMESDIYDDSQSDSGLSADFSPCSTVEISPNTTDSTAPQASETPIEKEIRRSIERERSLRRSRGLQNVPTAPQYVEIPLRKSILTQAHLPAKSERNQGKDRHYAGKKMQREIHIDNQREQDLVKIGTVPGGYDRGTIRQLRERQKLFEVFQEASGPSLTPSTQSKAPSRVSPSDLSIPENQGDASSTASTFRGSFSERRHSLDLLSPIQTPSPSPLGPGFPEGPGCEVIILENNNISVPARTLYCSRPSDHAQSSEIDGALNPPSPVSREYEGDLMGSEEEKEVGEEDDVVPKENPFFKLRSSTALDKVAQDIREAQERERELRRQRGSLSGGTKVGGGRGGRGRRGSSRGGDVSPASTERLSHIAPPPLLLNGLTPPDLPGLPSRGVTGPPTAAARQSLGKLGMWPPAHTEDQQVVWPESPPRTPRQKTPLLQRWELGLVNGHGDGEEEDN